MTVDDVVEFTRKCSKQDLYTIRREAQKRIDGLNEQRTVVASYSQWAYHVAELIYEHAKSVFPLTKEPNLVEWAQEIDRLVNRDGVPRELVEGVLKFAMKDDFWRTNIRSAKALRKHFEKIYVQGKSKFERGGRTYTV